MECNYLYIDDNNKDEADGVVAGLSLKDSLNIKFENPKGEWELERNRIESEDFQIYDGLILDLNLEENKNPENHKLSKYKGSTLAQEIRNLSKSGKIKELPIILLSATKNLKLFFDQTNEDLFDLVIEKEKLNHEQFIVLRKYLISLSSGYKILNKKEGTVSDLLAHNIEQEDVRFKSEIDIVISKSPSHSISNFMIKNLFEKDGVLIKEKTLAARLGVNIDDSEEWKNLLEILDFSKYKGVFCDGWERWWMSDIERWWEDSFGNSNSLRSLNASERVNKINTLLNFKLIPQDKLEKSKSEKFWTICIATGYPIDPIDGLLVTRQDNLYPWQDRDYVCFEEALKPSKKEIWVDLNETEKIKLEMLKKKFPNERPPRQ